MSTHFNPSKRASAHSRRLVALVTAVCAVCVAAGVAAGTASAAPPIGTVYCIDGRQPFSTWDAGSQHVSDKVVTQFGGQFTAGEVDPANVGRDPLRQYYDAIETSDAIGNYGVDTTIPNYVIHHISLGDCPFTDNHVFLCYSKFEADPGVWPVGQAQELLNDGYWTPFALSGNTTGGTNLGSFHLICNPPQPAMVPAPVSALADSTPVETPGLAYVDGGGSMLMFMPPADAFGYYPFLG